MASLAVTGQIHVCDVLEGLRRLPDNSIDCVVTSPPYWGLRDYGVKGQIGREKSPEAFVRKMREVFREVRRVLKPTGTCWVNLGDGYAGNGGEYGDKKSTLQGRKQSQSQGAKRQVKQGGGLKPKDLIGMPWRVALALQRDGWWLRQDIIWHKPNPMPESVQDRCTKAHEYIFLLTKSAKYFYDASAIREEGTTTDPRLLTFGDRPDLGYPGASNDRRRANYAQPNSPSSIKSPHGQGFTRRAKNEASGIRTRETLNANWDAKEAAGELEYGRNKRTVWTIATQGSNIPHFATFPEELPRLCILAGCPEGGVVLDPFAGSGTTLMVAKQLGRQWVGIEINPEYAAMAEARIASVTGSIFAEVSA